MSSKNDDQFFGFGGFDFAGWLTDLHDDTARKQWQREGLFDFVDSEQEFSRLADKEMLRKQADAGNLKAFVLKELDLPSDWQPKQSYADALKELKSNFG